MNICSTWKRYALTWTVHSESQISSHLLHLSEFQNWKRFQMRRIKPQRFLQKNKCRWRTFVLWKTTSIQVKFEFAFKFSCYFIDSITVYILRAGINNQNFLIMLYINYSNRRSGIRISFIIISHYYTLNSLYYIVLVDLDFGISYIKYFHYHTQWFRFPSNSCCILMSFSSIQIMSID
jgi:hypothetical protein